MNKNFILKADILDIIFEKRNKAYGAYPLRKFYPNRLKRALGFMLVLAAAFFIFILLPKKQQEVIARHFEIVETKLIEIVKPEEPAVKEEIEKPVVEAPKPTSQQAFTSKLLIVSDKEKTDSLRTLLPDAVIGLKNIEVPGTPAPPLVPVKPEPGTGGPAAITPKIDKTIPLEGNAVDVQPAFPGGMEALKRFLEKHLQNPYDLENGTTINVRVRFVVGYNGKLQGFETVTDGGEVYNKEVLRVLKKMPDWQPGKARGEEVSVYYTIPVKFVMSD